MNQKAVGETDQHLQFENEFQEFVQQKIDPDEMTRLRERVIFLATQSAGGRGGYKQLESMTGIKDTAWQQLILRRQMPTPAMLCAISRLHPQFALWILIGDFPGFEGHQGIVAEALVRALAPSTEQIRPASKKWREQIKSMVNLFK